MTLSEILGALGIAMARYRGTTDRVGNAGGTTRSPVQRA
jgi:hypothetical protein